MKGSIIAGFCFLVGLGVGVLINCRHRMDPPSPPPLKLQVEDIGKVYMYVKKGDTLLWRDEGNNKVEVNFSPASPCSAQRSDKSVCNVDVDSGFFKYDCNDQNGHSCEDPGVGVGTDIGTQGGDGKRRLTISGPYATPQNPSVYCDDTGTATGETITGTAGDSFEWFGAVNPWTVTVSPGTCTQGTTFEKGKSVCTLAQGAQTQSYAVHSTACAHPDGTGTLTVQSKR